MLYFLYAKAIEIRNESRMSISMAPKAIGCGRSSGANRKSYTFNFFLQNFFDSQLKLLVVTKHIKTDHASKSGFDVSQLVVEGKQMDIMSVTYSTDLSDTASAVFPPILTSANPNASSRLMQIISAPVCKLKLLILVSPSSSPQITTTWSRSIVMDLITSIPVLIVLMTENKITFAPFSVISAYLKKYHLISNCA